MTAIRTITIAVFCAALCFALADTARAQATTYEWESTGGFVFSPNRVAIEEITGQTAFPVQTPGGEQWVVAGGMRGTFAYDAAAATFLQSRGTAQAYVGASQAWTAHLDSAGTTIGSVTGDIGETIVRDGDPSGEADLLNVNMCTGPQCIGGTGFTIGNWRATFSSFVWIGSGFQDGFLPPATLPPPNAPEPLALFGFFNAETGQNVSILTVGIDFREAVQIVDIDIKPGSDPNCVNINGRGVIPVAILGSDELDVANVDQTSLAFGGLSVRVRGNRYPQCGGEYVNADEYLDLVCQFEDDSDAWVAGNDEAVLEGILLDGTSIRGSDSICLVP